MAYYNEKKVLNAVKTQFLATHERVSLSTLQANIAKYISENRIIQMVSLGTNVNVDRFCRIGVILTSSTASSNEFLTQLGTCGGSDTSMYVMHYTLEITSTSAHLWAENTEYRFDEMAGLYSDYSVNLEDGDVEFIII